MELPMMGADITAVHPTVGQPENSWTATLARLNETDRILRSAVAKLTANVTTTEHLAADLLTHKMFLDGIHDRVHDQSRVLGKITDANVARDAHLKAIDDSIAVGIIRVKVVESRLANVDEAITKFDDRLTGLCTEISDVRACVIPELCSDINREIHAAIGRLPLDTTTNASASLPDDHKEGANVPQATMATVLPTTAAGPNPSTLTAPLTTTRPTRSNPAPSTGDTDSAPNDSPDSTGHGGTPTRPGFPTP
jgi:hypothetical protein